MLLYPYFKDVPASLTGSGERADVIYTVRLRILFSLPNIVERINGIFMGDLLK